MDVQQAIDLGREALWTVLIIGAPPLATALLVGMLAGMLQALTQIHEQSVAFVPKLIAVLLVLGFMLPWLVARLLHYTSELITGIPGRL